MTSAGTKIRAGVGRIVLQAHGTTTAFSELSSTYPLKLLSPRIAHERVAIIYNLSYGGGLVGGDAINLSVEVGPGAVLVMLTQGSTKVFKTRTGNRASVRARIPSTPLNPEVTEQIITAEVSDQSALILLPDPVTCFRSASYNQVQIFRLSTKASLVLLDWVTSGRKSLGEEWSFSRYYSVNEVWVAGKRIAKDVLLLDEQETDTKPLPPRRLRDRLAPYSCYATVILYGPLVNDTISALNAEHERISVYKRRCPDECIWSLSPLTGGPSSGCIVRVAGKETEDVKNWLAGALRPLVDVVGFEVYRRTFAT